MGARVGTVVVVIAGCNGGPHGPSDAAIPRCGSLQGSPLMLDCAPGPTSCVLPPNQGVVDGARLHGRWWKGAAGDRIFQAIHDTVLDADCVAQDGRCFPQPGVYLFADGACTTPVLDSPVRHFFRTLTGVEILDPGAARASTFQIYRDPATGDHCVPSPSAGFDATVVRTVRFDTLVPFHQATQPASSALDLVVDSGDDGSAFTAIGADLPDAIAIDRARGAPCTRSSDRCLPIPIAAMGCTDLGCAFEGPTCETCDGTRQGSGSATRVGVGRCPGADDPRVVLVATVRDCSDGICACGSGGQVVEFVPPSAFPLLRAVHADGARLHVAALTDGDGYCRPLIADPYPLDGAMRGHAYDATLGVFCHPEMTAEGMRCVPDDENLADVQSNLFQDAACTQPITIGSNGIFTTDARFARDRTTNAYYALGTRGFGDLYQLQGAACLVVNFQDGWALGPRAEASFEALSDQLD